MNTNKSLFAKILSDSSSKEQSELINLFSRELFVACKGRVDFEMHLCSMSDHITKDGESLLRGLVEFLDLRKERMPYNDV